MLIVLIWVDDVIIFASDDLLTKDFKQKMSSVFKMTDLGQLHWFIGMQFIRSENSIEINQSLYIEKVLKRFNMTDCTPRKLPCDPNFANTTSIDSKPLPDAKLYQEIVGSLIYVMTGTRPDISYVVSKLAQFMHNPTEYHLSVAKNVLKYLKGTIHYSLKYSKLNFPIKLIGYCDSDWGSSEDRKSISAYCFMINSEGPLISWKTKKQQIVALSSCEAEYMSMTNAIQQGKFLRQLFIDLIGIELPINLGVDNQGAINLGKNPVYHQRSKHIDIRYHFIRDEISNGSVNLFYISTVDNPSDIFTKPVSQSKLSKFAFIRG